MIRLKPFHTPHHLGHCGPQSRHGARLDEASFRAYARTEHRITPRSGPHKATERDLDTKFGNAVTDENRRFDRLKSTATKLR